MLSNLRAVILAVLAGVAFVACDRADRENRESHSEIQRKFLGVKCNNPLSFDPMALIEARNNDQALWDKPSVMLKNTVLTKDPLMERTLKDIAASNDNYTVDESGEITKVTLQMSMKEARDFGPKNSIYVEKNCDNLSALVSVNELGMSTTGELTELTMNSMTVETHDKKIKIEEVTPEEDDTSALKLTGENVHTLRVTVDTAQADGSVEQTVYESTVGIL